VIRPAVQAGARRAGRDLAGFDFVANPFVVTGSTDQEIEEAKAIIRRHISFYTATRTYFAVLEQHGWVEVGEELVRLSKQNRWDEMPSLVSDEVLEELALIGRWEELPGRLQERYGGLVTTVNPVFGPTYPELQERQRRMFERLEPILPELKRVG
jgi:alkanesulfonate monooxygenase SsuD/methylene tetrahydromethanopterin reductase-like flavin-dependent oxidoreductase (luciferase family)